MWGTSPPCYWSVWANTLSERMAETGLRRQHLSLRFTDGYGVESCRKYKWCALDAYRVMSKVQPSARTLGELGRVESTTWFAWTLVELSHVESTSFCLDTCRVRRGPKRSWVTSLFSHLNSFLFWCKCTPYTYFPDFPEENSLDCNLFGAL